MKSNDAGASGGEVRDNPIDWFHHQVNINRGGDAIFTQRFQYHRSDGQVRYVVIVHDVEVHDIGTGSQRSRGVLTQAGKISRQN